VETVTHQITIYWRNGLAGMRFAKQGRIFDVVTVHDPDDTGCYLVCRPMEAGP
jgi:head-tail adaptor